MKTNELKSLLEKMDYSVKRINGMIVIENKYGNVIATIEENTTFKFSTQHYAWNFISYSEQKIILSYIIEYVATPIEEREEEKRFYLKHRWFKPKSISKNYLNHWIGTNEYWLDYKNETKDVQTRFTLKEIEEIKEKFNTDLADFKKIDVEDEN